MPLDEPEDGEEDLPERYVSEPIPGTPPALMESPVQAVAAALRNANPVDKSLRRIKVFRPTKRDGTVV